MPPSRPPARSVTRRTPPAVGMISSWACRAAGPGLGERVADLHALDRLDGHQRGGEAGVQLAVPLDVAAQTRRYAVRQHLDDAAERVGVLLGGVDLGDHPRARLGVEAAQRVGVDPLGVLRAGLQAGLGGDRPELDDVRDDLDAEGLLDELPWRPCRRRPGRRSRGRWRARGSAGRRCGRTSACRRGRRARGGAGSAGRCGPAGRASSGSTGSAAMTVSHFGHSELPTRMATGLPSVTPWRTPPRISTSSCSNDIRAPRP